MFPLKPSDDEPEEKDRTPPPLLEITELGHTRYDWIVTYHFFLGPLDEHYSMILGPLKSLPPEEALAQARDKASPLLAQARLALLTTVPLETRH